MRWNARFTTSWSMDQRHQQTCKFWTYHNSMEPWGFVTPCHVSLSMQINYSQPQRGCQTHIPSLPGVFGANAFSIQTMFWHHVHPVCQAPTLTQCRGGYSWMSRANITDLFWFITVYSGYSKILLYGFRDIFKGKLMDPSIQINKSMCENNMIRSKKGCWSFKKPSASD